ncbi:MAG TPA: DCC1-like thiol-disulfide oxidoreductase family protein [Solirubrobacterales bacterium]|nr:DCC1-like thiol-disulfide oxidoreductase family protein [Solirubrobacterales bacterium]
MPPPPGQERWTLLYDGACGFCKWILAGLLWLDRDRRLRPLALQEEEAEGLLAELDPDLWMASFHLVTPAGELTSAGEALPSLLELVRGGRVPAAILRRFPSLTARGYRWIAENRIQLSRFVPRRWKQRAAERVREREAVA